MRLCKIAGCAVLLLGCPQATWAQAWPGKQAIKIVSPFAPRAAPETLGRPVFDHVAKQLGQSVVWENRAGAGGTIGAAAVAVAKADPDGYTLLVNSSAHTVAPSAYANLRYDTARDFAAIAPLGQFPNVLGAPLARYNTIAELVPAGKSKPGSLTFGSAGVGSASHLNAEKFRLSAGFTGAHVPFKGAPDTLRELIGNRIDFAFVPMGSALPLVQGKEVRALAVSSPQRAASLPDVPTTVESGFAKSEYIFWIGAFAPGGTPTPIVQRLHQAITTALDDPAIKQALTKLGAEPMPQTTAQFGSFVRAEIVSNAELVTAAGLKLN